MPESPRYFDPRILSRLGNLDLIAREVVEGYITGLHKSPYHAFAVEFAQHREYVPGDEIKHVDWKVYARSDRYYIKQYEEETNLRSYFLLDTSESMRYASNGLSKLDYGCFIVASLTYLLLKQQDSAGLACFDNQIRRFIPSKASPAQLKVILRELEQIAPQKRTRMDVIFHELAERIARRGLVVIVSDLFDDPARILMGLRHFRHKRHEVIVFHVMDEAELTFPFRDSAMFEGLEDLGEILTEPRAIRRAYLDQVEAFVHKVKFGCRAHRVDYVQLSTAHPLDIALSAYLAGRAKRGKGK